MTDTQTLFMGYCQSRGKCHYIDVVTGYETKALCGARIVKFVTHIETGDPVPFQDHWRDKGHCLHCEALMDARETSR